MADKIPTSNTQPALILLGGDRRRRHRRFFLGDVSVYEPIISPRARAGMQQQSHTSATGTCRNGCVNRTRAREPGAARQASGCRLIKEEHLG